MSSIKTKEIRHNLAQKGFIEDNSRDHIWLNYFTPEGKKTIIRTKISHGKDSIGDPLILAMAKQVHLPKTQFIELVNCSLSGEEYYNIVRRLL